MKTIVYTAVMPYFLEVEVHSIIHSRIEFILCKILKNKKEKNYNLTRRCTFLFQDLVLMLSSY